MVPASASAPRSTSATSPRRRALARDAAARPALRHARHVDAVTILLARHGETDDNVAPIRIQGQRDTPLNDTRARAGRGAGRAGGRRGRRLAVVAATVPRARDRGDRRRADRPGAGRRRPPARRAIAGELEGRLLATRSRARIRSCYAAWRARRRRRSASPGASRCASSRTRVARRARRRPGGRAAARPRRLPRGLDPRRAVRDDPRGLDAFHDWEVPNVARWCGCDSRRPVRLRRARRARRSARSSSPSGSSRPPRLVADAERDQGLLAEGRRTAKARDPDPPQAHRRRQRLDPRRRRERRAAARAQPPVPRGPGRPAAVERARRRGQRSCPTASYRVRVGLRRQGRSVTLVDEVRIDATPPAPVVKVEKPAGTAGPLIFPLRGNAPVRFTVSNATVVGTPVFRVYRTDLPKPRAVTARGRRPGRHRGRMGRPDRPGQAPARGDLRDRGPGPRPRGKCRVVVSARRARAGGAAADRRA